MRAATPSGAAARTAVSKFDLSPVTHVFHITRNRLADQRGTAVIEMALALPLLLVLVLGILDFGKAFNYWNDVNHLAAEGARYAAVNRSPDGGDLKTYIKGRADTPELRSLAQVCISFPTGVAMVGEPVRVTVTADYNW